MRWLRAERPGGVFAQWRRAASLAQGEFVWIAEADDLAEPTLLEQLAEALAAAPEAKFAFADSRAIDAEGAVLWADHKAYYREDGTTLLDRSGVIPAWRFLREGLGARNLVLNASGALWRRDALASAIERAGTALAEFRLAGDWLVYAEALAAGGSVTYVAEPLNAHRRHRRGVTTRSNPGLHLDEIKRMHRHMRSLVGGSAELLAAQRRAVAAARRALKPADY